MKHDHASRKTALVASLLGLIAAPLAWSQAASQPTSPEVPDEETIQLSPFVVESTEEQGYVAKDTLAGTRVRTELKDIASSISVVTKQFLLDTGATNNQTLLQYTTNTEVGGVWGNFSGVGGGLQFNEDSSLLRPSNNTRVRGLDAADNTRDYFLTEIPWDAYNVDRVDMQRGPNSILFGVGSPAGIINTSINSAAFKNSNRVENRVGDFGSVRWSGDFNHVLIRNQLGIRLSVLDDTTKYRQKPAFNHDRRIFGAVRYTPKWFRDDMRTQIRVNGEAGKVTANRPRTLPPVDAVSPWFLTGNDAAGNRNLNKFTYDMSTVNPGAAPFNADNRGAYPYAWLNNGSVGRQFWENVVGYYGNANESNATLFRQSFPSGNRGIGSNGAPDQSIGGLLAARPVAVASYSSYMIASGIPGGSYYADQSLSDPSIFDFYNHLIDGRNKSEWQKWNAANIAVSQMFFNDRLGFELVYDRQRYQDGQRVFLGNSDTYRIGVDIVSHFADGTPNPNVGRAYIANSDEAANSLNKIDRDGLRFTGTGELRAEDFLDRQSLLARGLGRHVFTGLYSKDEKKQFNRNWATSASTADWSTFLGEDVNLTGHNRAYDYVVYLSDSLAGRSSAAGANLQPVKGVIRAPRSAMVRVFDPAWKGTANPADPYSYTGFNATVPVNPVTTVTASTQSENPANYVGWRDIPVNFYNADSGDIDALTFRADRQENIVKSQAFTWQGYFFDGNLVPVFGWRKDEVTALSAGGTPDRLGIVNPDFEIPDSSRKVQEGESKSYGVMAHVPAKWTSFLPGSTRISAFYNKSENFKADRPRGDVFGNVIANPKGDTKEYGFVISTLNERVTLKATWYETRVANATLPGSNPLGQNSYFLWAVPVWGTAFVTNADQGIKGNNDNNSWAWNYAATDDPNAPAFRAADGSMNPAWLAHPSTQALQRAINDWRNLPLDQTFFNAYGNEVAIMSAEAIRAGDWTRADPIWQRKFDNQPISGGLLAGFGTGPVFTVDTLSKGSEWELAAQPTKNWNVSVNASKTFATRASLAPSIAKLISDMTSFLAGPAGDIRLWGGGATNALRNQWQNNILNPYQTFKSQEGSNVPEVAPWRFNAVTTYSFDAGRLRGAFVGGGYRWEQGRVLGYQYNSTTGALDISKPLKGPSDDHLDLWLGYKHKLTNRIDWRIQLNLRNVGESKRLVPVSINPDGKVAFSRIQEGMGWQLTNSFEF